MPPADEAPRGRVMAAAFPRAQVTVAERERPSPEPSYEPAPHRRLPFPRPRSI